MFRDHGKGNRVVVLVNDQWLSGKLGRVEMHLAISIQVSSWIGRTQRCETSSSLK